MTAVTAISTERFHIRKGCPADENFIFATWLRAYKHSSSFARHIGNATYFKYHQAVVARILARGADVRISCPIGDADTILGYSVLEPGVVHFVYVKKPFRRLGIAKSLLEGVTPAWVFTHATDDWRWLHQKFPTMVYNPYLI